jgi:hypothetical protein
MAADWFDGVNAAFLMQRLAGAEVWRDALAMARMPDSAFSQSRGEILQRRYGDARRCDAATAVAALVTHEEYR